MNEIPIIVCMPLSGGQVPVAGSSQRKCSTCEQPVWVAPSGLRVIEQEEARIVCVPCGLAEIEEVDPEELQVRQVTEDQWREVSREDGLRRMRRMN